MLEWDLECLILLCSEGHIFEDELTIYYKSISNKLTVEELKETTRIYYDKKNNVPPISPYRRKLAQQDPIIDYGVYVFMYLSFFKLFIRKFGKNALVDPNNRDNHLPIWIYHSMDYYDQQLLRHTEKFNVPDYAMPLLTIKRAPVTEIEELEYFLNHFIEWNQDLFRDEIHKEMFNYFKDEFLNPDWRNILKNRNDAERWNIDYYEIIDDDSQWDFYGEWDLQVNGT